MNLCDLFATEKPLIGMVHLLPLPGSPRWGGSMDAVLRRAVEDARAWAEGGAAGVIVENFGDVPFRPGAVDPHTVAAMALAVSAVRDAVSLPVGVNVLRNDARAALGIAAVAGARFIRVNVHTGAMLTDQGIVPGRADETLRLRRELGAGVAIFADVLVKHAAPLAPADIAQVAADTFHRGLADALIVSGAGTGLPTPLEDVRRVKAALPEAPVLVGSGVTEATLRDLLAVADGAIVGTAAKVDGVAANPVSVERVRRLAAQAGTRRPRRQ